MRGFQWLGRLLVLAPKGMASTSHPLSTEAAVNILKNGGNATELRGSGQAPMRLRSGWLIEQGIGKIL